MEMMMMELDDHELPDHIHLPYQHLINSDSPPLPEFTNNHQLPPPLQSQLIYRYPQPPPNLIMQSQHQLRIFPRGGSWFHHHQQQKPESVEAMREMIFRMAALQPVQIDPESIKPPKRRNVKISKDPQSVAARHRRERISERIRILQRLVPGGTKMDTASMLDEAAHYMKFLKSQVKSLEQSASVAAAAGGGGGGGLMPIKPPPPLTPPSEFNTVGCCPSGTSTSTTSTAGMNHHGHLVRACGQPSTQGSDHMVGSMELLR